MDVKEKLSERFSAAVAIAIMGLGTLADLYFSICMLLYFWDGEWLNGALCFGVTILLSPISAIWRFTSIITWVGFFVCLIHRFIN